ncbi:MFS transporter [Acinetobacter nectaris]|uniref:MFS transporter n=1 Tax=Acinetobacter nectaris TaxID=1219382 RepID=UPI001F1E6E52|nr:MFS transporter [Acinetobacter nectaris]MCF9046042.1 MFS transporter [Acinetobacter nectaris]
MKTQADATPLVQEDYLGISFGTRSFQKAGIALFLLGFASFSLIYCVQPLLPAFTQAFHITPGTSALALSLTTGFLAFSIVLSSAFSQALGRKGLMFCSMSLAAVLNVLCAMSSSWHLLLIERAVEGFILGGVPAVAMAWIAEEINPKHLAKTMGLYIAGTAFGGMMGRVGMGLLTEYFSWRMAMAILGVLCFICAFGFLKLLPASKNFVAKKGVNFSFHINAWKAHLNNPQLLKVYGIGFLLTSIFVTLFNYITFRLSTQPYMLNQTQISLIFLSYSFGIISSSVAGSLVEKLGRQIIMRFGFIMMFIGALFTLSMNLFAIIIGVAFVTTGFFIAHSIASSNVSANAKSFKGHATSLYLLFYYLGSSIVGSLGGYAWQYGGWNAVVILAVVLIAVATLLTLNQKMRL